MCVDELAQDTYCVRSEIKGRHDKISWTWPF